MLGCFICWKVGIRTSHRSLGITAGWMISCRAPGIMGVSRKVSLHDSEEINAMREIYQHPEWILLRDGKRRRLYAETKDEGWVSKVFWIGPHHMAITRLKSHIITLKTISIFWIRLPWLSVTGENLSILEDTGHRLGNWLKGIPEWFDWNSRWFRS